MKVLFIDHECHQKTRSADFFMEVLRRDFEVSVHSYSTYYRTHAEENMPACDIAVIWEFLISRRQFFFWGKRNVFVPMYDNEWASYWQWRRIAWSGMGVISFCDAVTRHARRCGVKNLLDVRYFPNPDDFPQEVGDPRKVFLWERGYIGRGIAENLFPPDSGYSFVVKSANLFLSRKDYFELLSSCDIVISPRQKEGIGMVFLEAMAMGKCVAANDDATMNEYIENDTSGILFDSTSPCEVDYDRVKGVRRNMRRVAKEYYMRWKKDQSKIRDFVAKQPICNPSLGNRIKLVISYPLYLLEGLFLRLGEKLSHLVSAPAIRE